MPRATGQLERSLAALTIGLRKGMDARARSNAMASGEYTQQLRVPLSGQVGSAWIHQERAVTWQLPFLYAPQQRNVPFLTPQFHASFEFVAPAKELVVLQAHINGWTQGPNGWIVGAVVRFAVQAPNAATDVMVDFSVSAHLTFQGYAAYPEGGSQQ